MAFVTERITNMICERLTDYGYQYDGQMYPQLYPVYLKVAGVIQIRLGLKKGFLKSEMNTISTTGYRILPGMKSIFNMRRTQWGSTLTTHHA